MRHKDVRHLLEEFSRARIAHAILRMTLVEVERAIMWPTGRPLICVAGALGSGKTALAETLCDRATAGDGRFPGPALLVTAPRNERGECDWESLYRTIHRAMEVPFADEIWAGNSGTPPRFSQASKTQRDTMQREATYEIIREANLSAVIVDRAERLLAPGADQEPHGGLLHLASMAEDTGTPHVALLPYSAMPLLLGSWELSRRCRLIHLRPYRGHDKADMTEFVRSICEFVSRLPSPLSDSDLIPHAEYLFRQALGLIGLLHEILLNAASCALSAEHAKLRIDHLAAAAMTQKQLRCLRKEILRGEGYFGLKAKDLQQLQLHLTFPDEEQDGDTPVGDADAKPEPKRRKSPVGKPKPRRRPIGMEGNSGSASEDDEDEHAPESP